ncbi:hypothetical protein GMLC_20720 [Geomonas limicola]|uniref:Uncharacterized protein n=1 Tax=Geomonas limicola TaxID=2740186 RepID=A0A6V8NAC9_9BACT|nr:hypothetical protein [Geomonas limicola]GFO68493.1 hypothetical protein GMLC_20720 [Geomonas limicola]
MTITPVAKDAAAVFSPPVAQQNHLDATVSPASAAPSPDIVRSTQAQDDVVVLSGNRERAYQELQVRNEHSNDTAQAIRRTDRSLHVVSQKVDSLKAPLEAIVKNFPPFAPEDKARVALLKEYAGLRKEIDQLTTPPPPEVLAARRAEAGQAPKGQSLPEPLPMDATDSQIADHLTKLDAAGAALDSTRADLAAGTSDLVQSGRFSAIFSRANSAETGVSEIPLSERGASEKSLEVGRQFASSLAQGMASASPQFLKGLS